jgi:hypothetical protein
MRLGQGASVACCAVGCSDVEGLGACAAVEVWTKNRATTVISRQLKQQYFVRLLLGYYVSF